MSFRTEKQETIIKLWKEGKTWNEIAHDANTSPKIISKVVDDYEQSEAFKLFHQYLTPTQVRIKLSLSAEKVEKLYLAFRRLRDLFNLPNICRELGEHIPDFLDFYKIAKSFNITPNNVNDALNLAKNIEFLKQENYRVQETLKENRKANAQEATNLAEVQSQLRNAVDRLSGRRSELEVLQAAIDNLKNTSEYILLEDTILKTVNSLTSEKYFLFEVVVIAVMRTIQKDPTLNPLILFPFPDKLDLTAQTQFHQYILITIINKATKFMPVVLEELAKLVGNRILPELQNIDLLIESNMGLKEQQNIKDSPIFQADSQIANPSRVTLEHATSITVWQENGVKEKSILNQHDKSNTLKELEYLDDSWYGLF